jgi:hypothetical protein
MLEIEEVKAGQSKFKKHLHDKILVAGMKEGLAYRITAVKGDFPLKGIKSPPTVGEIIYLKHDYKPDEPCSFGWDRLSLYIGRYKQLPGGGISFNNFVEYYSDLQELEQALSRLELELAVDLAIEWIEKERLSCETNIARLKREYGIE